ncbi:hypothetical protein [Piscinibacter sp.]|nr:hypothetical protein [Albitalea sp.]HUG21683.1 hypothetical protein [Albitalea sp.]
MPAGSYRLRVWHPRLAAGEPTPVPLSVGMDGVDQRVKLNLAGPLK